MVSGPKKRQEHEADFIAFPSPSPPSSPSPSHQRERNFPQISLQRNYGKLLRKMVSDDIQKLMGEFGSPAASRPKWNPRTQMFDLKENEIPALERTNQISQKEVGSDILTKRIEVERLATAAGFYPDKENRDENMDAAEQARKKEWKRQHAERKAAASRARFEKKVARAVARFGTDEELLAAKQRMLNQKQELSKLEKILQREAEEAMVETPKKKKRKINHESSEETPNQSSAMLVYSYNPHKRRNRKSTVTDLVGNESENLQASPTFLIPASFLTKGFAKQQALSGTILKSCSFKPPNAPELLYNNVGMATNYNHHESAILPRKLSITSSSTESSLPISVKKRGHVATRAPITPLKSTKPKPSRTRSRPTPLADDSDSENDSPSIITRTNKSAGDNEREWEESFSKVVASLKRTSVSKIKTLFNEEGEESGEVESLSGVVNSIKQATSVDKIRSMLSPGRATANGAGKRRMSVSPPTVSSKVNSDHSQHLQFRAIATCRLPSTTVSSKANGEHLQHLQSPAGFTFQLLRIAPGHDEAFPAAFDGTRICSVAKGRVKVTYSKKKFNIGEGEAWGVRRGELFIVHNPSSEEAVVHVVTIWDAPKFGSEGALPETFKGFI